MIKPGMEFAPPSIPLKRRLQTAAVVQWVASFLFLGFTCAFFMISLCFTRFWFLPIVYLPWYIYDRKTPFQGGRRFSFFRRLKLWDYFKDFFPLTLVKTCDLDPTQNYIFALHPHGVLCVSHFSHFATEATGFSKLYPAIRPTLLVLDGHFSFPLYREYLMTSGMCSCNRDSMEYLITKNGQRNAVCLAVGGALEVFEAHPGHLTLVLAGRKSFIKAALQTGTSLVPVFSFGENELYVQVNNPAGSTLRNIQHQLTKYLGIPYPLFHGGGIFNFTFGLLPYSKPIYTVVGEPIEVKQNPLPADYEVDALHKQYVEALQKLFEAHKQTYGIPEVEHLKFI